MQTELDEMRQGLYEDIKNMVALKKGKPVKFSEDQPLIHHDGDSITIEGLHDSDTADGIGENGQRYDLDIAELGIDDVKAIAERLAQEVL